MGSSLAGRDNGGQPVADGRETLCFVLFVRLAPYYCCPYNMNRDIKSICILRVNTNGPVLSGHSSMILILVVAFAVIRDRVDSDVLTSIIAVSSPLDSSCRHRYKYIHSTNQSSCSVVLLLLCTTNACW